MTAAVLPASCSDGGSNANPRTKDRVVLTRPQPKSFADTINGKLTGLYILKN